MSVLIDIPMPDCCVHCPLYEGYGCAGTGEIMLKRQMETGRSELCPIITELPAKHGRLIDIDALNWYQVTGTVSAGDNVFGKKTMMLVEKEHVDQIPTVIEAEGE